MKTLLNILTLTTIVVQFGLSQKDNSSAVMDSTESLYYSFHEKLIKYSLTEKDSIKETLEEWQLTAGRIEPIERIKILLDISLSNFESSNYEHYYSNFITNYIYRVNYAEDEDSIKLYKERKGFFNYVPLNSKLDYWTKNIAIKLLRLQDSQTDEKLLCQLFSNELEAFDSSLRKKSNETSTLYSNYVNSLQFSRRSEGLYKIYLGVWNPIGKLKNDFNSTFTAGAAFGFPFKLKYRIEAKIQVAFNPDKSTLEFEFDNNRYTSSDLSIISGGFRFTRENKLSNDYRLDTSAEINLGVISTNLEDGDEGTHAVETIDLGVGIGLKRLIGNNKGIGVESFIHVAPYGINNKLVSETGLIYLTTNVFFSF